jgi:uncharacterized protein
VRFRALCVPIPGLPEGLRGVRIAHLSDFHLGVPSRGTKAVERSVDWAEARSPDLTLISGDLLSRPRGEALLRTLLDRLPRCYAVLGNHDFAVSRDPWSEPTELYDLGNATLLSDEARLVELNGHYVQIAGVDPRSYMEGRAHPDRLSDPQADLRILVCHFPEVIDYLRPGSFHLVVAGHLHAGQICVPFPGGRLPLAHLRWDYMHGLYRKRAGTLHVSPGLGTTFIPLRFLARPEATELVLDSAE